MLDCKKCERGIFHGNAESLRKIKGRYILKIYIPDLDGYVNLDVHDSLYETASISNLTSYMIKNIFYQIPSHLIISNIQGFWKLENELQILSDAIIRAL